MVKFRFHYLLDWVSRKDLQQFQHSLNLSAAATTTTREEANLESHKLLIKAANKNSAFTYLYI